MQKEWTGAHNNDLTKISAEKILGIFEVMNGLFNKYLIFRILLLFDAHKLDISDEFRRSIEV